MQAERYIAAADIGTSKVALSVAKVDGENIQIIWYKEVPSDGIRYSAVFNPTRAAVPLKAVIQEAEKELNIKILQLVVGLPRYSIRQETASALMKRSDPDSCITREEINSLKSIAIDSYPLENEAKEEIYGAVAQSFSADEDLVCACENDVVGVAAESIEGHFKIFIGNKKAVHDIDRTLNEVWVAPARKLFVPGAVAQAVLTDAEKENGVALVEVGAGVTSVTVYKGRLLRHYSSIPFGGKSITNDIKYECGFTESLAENIKLAFGACLPDKLQTLGDKVIQINDEENGTYEQLPVKYLSETITYMAREIIEAVLFLIQQSGYADLLRNGVVLTGGGSSLVNFAQMFKEMSGYTVRIGYPRTQIFSSGGCPGATEASAAASIGMILEARRDSYLNCIEDAGMPASADTAVRTDGTDGGQETSGTEEQTPRDGTLFPDEEIIMPSKGHKKKEKKEGGSVIWGKLRRKISSGLEGAFDNTVGDLFDSMK